MRNRCRNARALIAVHLANLDFWFDEVAHCLHVIDQYSRHFKRLAQAQKSHVVRHQTIEFDLSDPCCTRRRTSRPVRISDHDLSGGRRELCDAFYRFIVRCCRAGLISRETAVEQCRQKDISVDGRDLEIR